MTDKDKDIKKNKTEEEAPVEETAPEEEAPVEETAAEEEAPVEETAAEEEAPVEETAAEEEAPVEETAPEEEAPVEETAPEEEAPVDVDHNTSDKKAGTVKWFDSKKGYGFIELEGNDDIFVHFSDIAEEGYKSLRDGQKVEFEIEKDDQGEKAKNVTKVED